MQPEPFCLMDNLPSLRSFILDFRACILIEEEEEEAKDSTAQQIIRWRDPLFHLIMSLARRLRNNDL